MRRIAVLLTIVMSAAGMSLAYSDPIEWDPSPILLDAAGYATPLDPGSLNPPVVPGVQWDNDAPSYLPVGDTTITWVASYDEGGHSIHRQTVTVRDNIPPTCPDLEALEYSTKPGKRVEVVFDLPIIADNADLDVDVVASPESGSKFPIGNHMITFTATDDSGNSIDCTQDVAVSQLVIENLNLARTSEKIRATWDPFPGHDTYRLEIADTESGEWLKRLRTSATTYTFVNLEPETEYTVSVRAVGDRTSEASRTTSTLPAPFDPRDGDTTPPVIDPPEDILLEASGPLTPAFSGIANATDDLDPRPSISTNAPDRFPVGITTVTWWAIDHAGNKAEANHTVTIQDTTPPIFTSLPASATHTTYSPDGITVDFEMPVATDIADPDVTVKSSHAPGSLFKIGNTTVTFTALDDSGNAASREIVITVSQITGFQAVTDDFSDLDQWEVNTILCSGDPVNGTFNNYTVSVVADGGDSSAAITGDADCGQAVLGRNVDTGSLGDDDLFIGIDFRAQAPEYSSTDNRYFSVGLLVGSSDGNDPIVYGQKFSGPEWMPFSADITDLARGSDGLLIGILINDSSDKKNSMVLYVDNFYIGTEPPDSTR